MEPDKIEIEDNNWLDVPGENQKVSPDGVVYSSDGEPLYSLFEDAQICHTFPVIEEIDFDDEG